MSDVFTEQKRFAQGWTGGLPETPCGSGSKLENTKAQRQWIPRILSKYRIKSIVDIGAGDLNWLKHMPLDGIEYTPLDLFPRFADIKQFDLVREVPPPADLIMCLWVLNHMPFDDCQAAIANLKASGNRWLLMTDRPKWHYEQPPEIRMEVTDELLLNPKTGDRIILVELNAPEVEDADYPGA